MHVTPPTSAELRQELQEITNDLHTLTELAQFVQQKSGRLTTTSDVGWLLSMVAGEAGTLLAVSAGINARTWDVVARKIDAQMTLLQVKQMLKEQELQRK